MTNRARDRCSCPGTQVRAQPPCLGYDASVAGKRDEPLPYQDRRLVLDSCCVRGVSREHLAELRALGFRISISMLALSEVWARAARTLKISELQARCQNLAGFVDEKDPIIPTGTDLLGRLGGRVVTPPFRQPDPAFQKKSVEVWRLLSHGQLTEDALRKIGMESDREINDLADGWLDTGRGFEPTLREQVRALPEAQAVKHVATWFINTWGKGMSIRHGRQERLHGYFRLVALYAVRAATGAHTTTANDAEDVQLMMHLADDVLVVTADHKLIQRVDETATFQAPYITTVGELLARGAPQGPPWGRSARKAVAAHAPRTRNALVKLDQAVRAR